MSIGSTMPCTLRNDQHWTSRMIRSAAPKKIGIFGTAGRPLADHGDATQVDVHIGVALGVDDLVQPLVER